MQWNIIQPQKNEWNLAIHDNIDWPCGRYVKWNKSERETQRVFFSLLYVKSKKEKNPPPANPNTFIENKLVVARGGDWGAGEKSKLFVF